MRWSIAAIVYLTPVDDTKPITIGSVVRTMIDKNSLGVVIEIHEPSQTAKVMWSRMTPDTEFTKFVMPRIRSVSTMRPWPKISIT